MINYILHTFNAPGTARIFIINNKDPKLYDSFTDSASPWVLLQAASNA